MESNEIIQELTPLGEHDLLYVADRHKVCCDFPLHRHNLFELNFVEHGAGCERFVGDSVETLDEYDLVLIAAPNLEHAWTQGQCTSTDIHEITVQFYLDPSSGFLSTNPFRSIQKMFERAQRGLAFPMAAIMSVYSRLSRLASIPCGFEAAMEWMYILHELSKYDDARELSSSSFAQVRTTSESRRVARVKEYVSAHYMEEIRLEQLAAMVSMSPTAFSRFFKLRTGKSLSDYIVDVRLGVAWDNIPLTDEMLQVARQARAICFGSLAQRSEVSRRTIHAFLDAAPSVALRVFDINLRQHWYTADVIAESLNRANILKINDEELDVVATMLLGVASEPGKLIAEDPEKTRAVCRDLIAKYDLRMLILTCGAIGSYVFTDTAESYVATPKVKVADTVGAGDSFTATFVAQILLGKTIPDAHRKAVQVSAFVCTQAGAMPVLPDELK